MQAFTIINTGYSVGYYGCSGEYFTLMVFNDDTVDNFLFSGMYGAEDRVAEVLKEKGYKYYYSFGNFGKIAIKDVRKAITESEYSLIDKLKVQF